VTVTPLPRVTLLDGFALHLDDAVSRRVLDEPPRSVQRLIAHLCLSPRPPRAAVAGHLWPDAPEDHAHGSLRSALWRLHKLAPGLVEASGSTIALADGVRVDVRELADWARRVCDPRCGLDELDIPDAGLQGELLPGWYDDWVQLERENLRQVRMHALEVLAHRLAEAGRYAEALQAAYSAVRAEPLRESAHRIVVRIHVTEGNLSEALRVYEQFRTMLAAELGLQPSGRMTQLVDAVRRPAQLPD
jgi:DNA-binding SARP family transcriptional activator